MKLVLLFTLTAALCLQATSGIFLKLNQAGYSFFQHTCKPQYKLPLNVRVRPLICSFLDLEPTTAPPSNLLSTSSTVSSSTAEITSAKENQNIFCFSSPYGLKFPCIPTTERCPPAFNFQTMMVMGTDMTLCPDTGECPGLYKCEKNAEGDYVCPAPLNTRGYCKQLF